MINNFINSLDKLKVEDPETFELLKSTLESKSSEKKLHPFQNRDLPVQIQSNLKKYGVDMKVYSDEEWEQFCDEYNETRDVKLDKNAKSFFLDGKIYVRKTGFTVDDAVHELQHLLLAAMRAKDFAKYKTFIETLYQHNEVQEIAKKLTDISVYTDQYELNFKEEAVVRYLEGLFTGNISYEDTFKVGDSQIYLMNYLDDNFKESVEHVFGISSENFPGMCAIFKSTLGDLPGYGSEIFGIRPMPSTGYISEIIEEQQIGSLIDYWLQNGQIKKVEC